MGATRNTWVRVSGPPDEAACRSSPIDFGHLCRYTLGDRALELEVLSLYAADISARIEALRQARTDKDWKMAAHTLKGSSRAVGAWRVADLAQEAERLGGPNDAAACQEAIGRTEQAAIEARQFIEQLAGPDA